MKAAALFLASLILASCVGDAGHFDGTGGKRRGHGNAQLEGPDARDVIRDTHRDRARQNYEDRSHRRHYGNY